MENFKHWPPTLPAHELDDLLKTSLDYAMAHGLLMRPATTQVQVVAPDPTKTEGVVAHHQQNAIAMHAPFALFPSPFPRSAYAKALQLQCPFNTLMHRVSEDIVLLKDTFEKLSKSDEFSARLYHIWTLVQSAPGPKQKMTLGIHRSDYMIHHDVDGVRPLQVELNTIAASFASLSTLTGKLHRYLARRTQFYNASDPTTADILPETLPPNQALQGLAQGIAKAFQVYCQRYHVTEDSAVVMMVVQPNERNIFDQRWIEIELFERHAIKLLRKTLTEIALQGSHLGPEKRLMVDGMEVAVTYFRAGYGPADYPSDQEWQARLFIEQSFTVKCPSMAYQLVGAKKVQQILSDAGMLERYMSPTEAKLLRSCFAGIFPLDDTPEGRKAYEQALAEPDRYVMKPQREGGGNNFYGQDIPAQLNRLSADERSSYILMERIRPPPYKNVLVRLGVASEADVITELGVYGVYFHDGETEVLNEAVGTLLRTKTTATNEGGVATGFAVIDSPFLVDE